MKSFAVIGLGRFGAAIAKYIEDEGGEVLAIEQDSAKVREFENEFTSVVEADASDINALRDLGISDVDAAIVSIGTDMSASILITLLLKELEVPLIIAKAQSPLHGSVMHKIGANRVVYPEDEVAKDIARQLIWPGFNELELAPGLVILEISVPKIFASKSLSELKLRSSYEANVIAVKKKEPYLTEDNRTDYREKIIAPPEADTVVEKGDSIILVCSKESVEKFRGLK